MFVNVCREFYSAPAAVYQHSGKFCFWGDTANSASKQLHNYERSLMQRPGSNWSNLGS